jgi:hypothetical protein
MIRSLALLLIAAIASGHSWYEDACCGKGDCRPVPADDVLEISEGVWKYLPTGNVFDNAGVNRRVRPSKDKSFHVCIGPDQLVPATPLPGFIMAPGPSFCIYVVQGN